MACKHVFIPSEQELYQICKDCGTYRSELPINMDSVYKSGKYWGPHAGHSTLVEQISNINVKEVNGVTKGQSMLNLIDVPRREAALEIGCAPGIMLFWLQASGFERVVGIEVDRSYEQDIRYIGRHTGDLLWGYFPEAAARLAKHQFDLILAMDVLEHTNEPELFLQACSELLVPGGQLLLMLPLTGVQMTKTHFHPLEHRYVHSAANLHGMLQDCGFINVAFSQWDVGHDTVSAYKA